MENFNQSQSKTALLTTCGKKGEGNLPIASSLLFISGGGEICEELHNGFLVRGYCRAAGRHKKLCSKIMVGGDGPYIP